MRRLAAWALGFVCLLGTDTSAYAQLSTAQISGRVTDQTGEALAGALVTASHVETGAQRTSLADDRGAFVLPNLPTGPYRLQVSLEGFRSHVQTGLALLVGDAQVVDVVLSVGTLEEVVAVDARGPLVDVESAGTRMVVRHEQIVALPLNGRNAVELVTLTGAAVQTHRGPVTSLPGGAGIAIAGGQGFGVAYLLDGAMHNSPNDNLSLPLPFPDALQEFSVGTSGLSAQHGMHGSATVNAVTKSGSNRIAGNVFEFFRDRRFNATDPFAQVGADGRRLDDGLVRHQFGGTVGGPLLRDRLFFFGGYQGTTARQRPSANIAWIPTPAMLAGDFTQAASPACNGGRQLTLRGGFAGNRIDPDRFSPAAVNLTKYLPVTTDPCGEVTYSQRRDSNQSQIVGRLDFQQSAASSIFARYMATSLAQPEPMGPTDSVLSLYDSVTRGGISGLDNLAQSLALGHTRVLGDASVNSLRISFNRSAVQRFTPPTFDPSDLGAEVHSYHPDVMTVTVNGAFVVANQGPSRFVTNAGQVSDDLTFVRGAHQISVGGSAAYWRYWHHAHGRSGGTWIFTGQATGSSLADLMLGRVSRLEHGGPGWLPTDQWYVGLYVQDTWRPLQRLTLNAGLRWEPYFGAGVRNGAVYNFSRESFRNNARSTVFTGAPAGLMYPGDAGFPTGRTGLHTQWWNLSPRLSAGWDITGDARTALRASYGLSYDFPTADYHLMNAQAPPFGNRTLLQDPPGGFDRPYAHVGGDPHPIETSRETVFLAQGAFGATDPHANSPRIQQWHVTLERQLGAVWQVAASYLGSHTDRLWNVVALNPGVFLGLEPCTLAGVFYPTCSTTQNLEARRRLALSGENPAAARLIGNLDLHTSLGTQEYHGLKLSFARRAADGLSMTGNYTLSRCFGDPSRQTGSFPLLASGYTDPDNPSFDRGICDQDRTHIANLALWVMTPRLEEPVLRAILSGWSLSGLLTARSGSPVNVVAGIDAALTGINNQRVNQVLADGYGARTIDNWLNPAAFALPAPGTLGEFRRNSLRGPAYWSVDAALARFVPVGSRGRLELRVEAFNVFNTFNWGSPSNSVVPTSTDANFSSPSFGRITTMAGTPRVLQFGLKYQF